MSNESRKASMPFDIEQMKLIISLNSRSISIINAKFLLFFVVTSSFMMAGWILGVHALQGQPVNIIYSLSIGISISISYLFAILIVDRRAIKKTNVLQSILIEFVIFEFSAAFFLAVTFTISRNLVPYGAPSPLWPGLFIRQAPISLAVFFVYWALALAIGAKRAAKPRSAKPCLGDATLLEAQGNYVRVTTPTGSRMIRMTLAMAEQSLPMEQFCRIHRSRIVRRDQIESVDWLDATVRLTTGETVKASSSGLAQLRTVFS